MSSIFDFNDNSGSSSNNIQCTNANISRQGEEDFSTPGLFNTIDKDTDAISSESVRHVEGHSNVPEELNIITVNSGQLGKKGESKLVLRDAHNPEAGAVFDRWWKTFNYHDNRGKILVMHWGSDGRGSKVWGCYEEGAWLVTGEPRIWCPTCQINMTHPRLVGNTTMNRHSMSNNHVTNAKNYCKANKFGLQIPHENDHQGTKEFMGQFSQYLNHTPAPATFITAESRDLIRPREYNQETFSKYILYYFLASNTAFNAVSLPEFRRMLFYLRDSIHIPGRSTLHNLLSREYSAAVVAIRNMLPRNVKLSLALDGWTSPNKIGVLSIIAYFVDESWNLQEVQLAFDQVSGTHDGATLKTLILGVIKRYDIGERLLGITTDNATSNATMAKMLQGVLQELGNDWEAAQNHVPCMAHVIQLSLNEFMNKLQVSQREKYFADTERNQHQMEDADIGTQEGRRKYSKLEKFAKMPWGFNKIIEKQRRLAVAINSSTKRWDLFTDMQSKECKVAVSLIMDVKTRWNSTLMMLQRAYRLRRYTEQWLAHPNNSKFRVLYTTNLEWRAIEYMITLLEPVLYWTLWMSKRHTVSLNMVCRVYDHMFTHWENKIKLLERKATPWKKNLCLAIQAAHQKLKDYWSNVTPEQGILMLLGVMLDPTQKLLVWRKWDHAERFEPEHLRNNFTTKYRQAFLAYFVKHYNPRPTIEISEDDFSQTPIPQRTKSKVGTMFGPPSLHISDDEEEEYDLATEDTEFYSDPPPGKSWRKGKEYSKWKSCLDFAIAYIDSKPLKLAYSDLDDDDIMDPGDATQAFPSDEVLRNFWLENTYKGEIAQPLVRMARDIYSVVPNGVGCESSFSIGRHVVGWQQGRMKGETLRNIMVTRQYVMNRDRQEASHASKPKGYDKKEQLDRDYQVERRRVESIARFSDARYAQARATAAMENRRRIRHNINRNTIEKHGFISDNEADIADFDSVDEVSEYEHMSSVSDHLLPPSEREMYGESNAEDTPATIKQPRPGPGEPNPDRKGKGLKFQPIADIRPLGGWESDLPGTDEDWESEEVDEDIDWMDNFDAVYDRQEIDEDAERQALDEMTVVHNNIYRTPKDGLPFPKNLLSVEIPSVLPTPPQNTSRLLGSPSEAQVQGLRKRGRDSLETAKNSSNRKKKTNRMCINN